MFSVALEMVLSVAFREALTRRHAHLTLEHLLYAIANDPGRRGDPAGRRASRLPALRAELKRYLEQSIEGLPKGTDTEPAQTLAFRRVLQTVVLHSQSAGREEANVGDVLAGAAAAAEVARGAAAGGAGRDPARRPELHLARRHQAAAGRAARRRRCPPEGEDRRGRRPAPATRWPPTP